ncbi:zinc carboxypeptidase-like [Agrilus planipennis]|uniref:Zinc carboxypeptidase-like n=1 Tax=Agrilus planipennis TaxID=224129 RepID=A0A1W4WN62_AGRPL|nr:zinc carboxypeptidase-like [Agrilus planipennis]
MSWSTMRFLFVLSVLIVINVVLSHEVNYENYKVYKVYIEDDAARDNFLTIQKQIPDLDIWGENRDTRSLDVMVSPTKEVEFTGLLRKYGISQEITTNNVEGLLKSSSSQVNTRSVELNWTSYHNYDVIYSWFDSLAELYPENVTTFVAGYSYLGAEIKGIRIQLRENATRVAVIDGGIHAREWISIATATYIANQFLTTTNSTIRAAAEEVIWYILPVLNPDGYNYTIYVDRMHRKNMQVNESVDCSGYSGGSGIGVDLNRNFAFYWMANGGASSYPCSVQYAGPYPFSAPESQAFRSFIGGISENLDLYLTLHSYSQLILFPYGHTTQPLDNYYEQYTIGRMAADAIESNSGRKYIVGNSAEAIYISTGGSDDWVKGTFGTRLVYTYEVRDTGTYGFLLPPDQIIDTAEEVLASIPVLVQQLIRLDTWSTTRPISSSANNPSLNLLLLLSIVISAVLYIKL